MENIKKEQEDKFNLFNIIMNRQGELFIEYIDGNLMSKIMEMIESGIDINYKENDSGCTGLSISCLVGSLPVVQLLLDSGANPNIKCDDGNTPLMLAAAFDDKKILNLLLRKGADPFLKNNKGETAYDIAVDYDIKYNIKMIKDKMDSIKLDMAKKRLGLHYIGQEYETGEDVIQGINKDLPKGGRKKSIKKGGRKKSIKKSKKIPKHYVAKLSKKDKDKQVKSIKKARKSYKKGVYVDRPKLKSFKSKRSSWVIKFEKKYGKKITNKTFIHNNIISRKGQELIMDKGKGAYYSSGSRPNQTGSSWTYARLASVILNGPARKYDKKIWDKYKI